MQTTEEEFKIIQAEYDKLKWGQAVDLSPLWERLEGVDICDPASGNNLYHLAAKHLDVELVRNLSENGVKPRHNHSGATPLHTVAAMSMFQWEAKAEQVQAFAEAVIAAGANIKRKDDRGKTAALLCAENANWAVLGPITAAGAKLDDIAEEGKNLLHVICARMQVNRGNKKIVENGTKVVKLLLESGRIDPEDKDIFGTTPVTYLQRANLLDVAALFTDDEQDKQTGGMAIDQAVLLKNHAAAKALLDGGADANHVSEQYGDKTLLMLACSWADDQMVDLLLAAGAAPNHRLGQSGRTAVHFLLAEGFSNIHNVPPGKMPPQMRKILRSLERKKLDPSGSIDDRGNTALHFIAAGGSYMAGVEADLAETFLEMEADPDRANLDGETPLMVFARNGDENKSGLAEMLLDTGADVAPRDRNGQTALHHAARNRNHSSALKIARQILEKDPAVLELTDNESKTAMDYAVDTNNEPLTKLLLN